MRRDRRIFKEFDQDKVKVAVDNAIEEVLANPDWYNIGSWGLHRYETKTHMLEIFAADRLGQYQAKEIVERFGIRAKWDDEWIWETIDNTFGNVADLLNKAIDLSHPKFQELRLGFGHTEGSSDWGLMLLFEMKAD